jgi:hypothetical protein
MNSPSWFFVLEFLNSVSAYLSTYQEQIKSAEYLSRIIIFVVKIINEQHPASI